MDYKIKRLTPHDLPLVKHLAGMVQLEDGMLKPESISDDYLISLLSKDTFHALVAVDGNGVAGGLTAYELPMFAKQESEMFLYDIIVHENYRQQGIGKGLIEELKNICSGKGIKIIFVGTSMDSEAAIQLYQSTGGRREDIPWFTYQL